MQRRLPFRSGEMLLLATGAAMLMLGIRVILTGNFYYFFLAWNLFLAWIPYLLSGIFRSLKKFEHNRWLATFVFGGWLLFLPNSPYLLTDLVHLSPRTGVPLWYDALLIVLFAWTGLLLGLISMIRVHRYIQASFSEWLSRLLLLVILLSCSFGIYVGRVLRWNSWDLVVRPLALMKSLSAQFLHPFHHLQSCGMTLSFSLFLGLSYYSVRVFTQQRENGSEIK